MQIPIDIEDLKSVGSMTEDDAQQIIDETTKVLNQGEDNHVKPENQRISLEVPTDLDGGPWVIV